MIDAEMTRDIREYEPKLFNLITVRQLVLLVIGFAIAIPLVLFLPIKDITYRIIIGTVAMSPMIACGWVTVYGMKLERFILQIIKTAFLMPKTRKYKPEGTVDYLPAPVRYKKTAEKKKIQRSKDFVGRK